MDNSPITQADWNEMAIDFGLVYDAVNTLDKEVYKYFQSAFSHIGNVANCYNDAYKRFSESLEKQKEFTKNLTSLLGDIFSIVGAGTLSWLSSSGELLNISIICCFVANHNKLHF